MKINTDLLKTISETPGAPGFERRIRNLVIDEVTGLCDEVKVDNMGNVAAIKKGKSSEKSAMVAAHMDEIGFVVTHIDENGFIRFQPLGGFDPKTLTAQRVIVQGKKDIVGVMGSKPIHVMTQEERKQQTKIKDYFIDTGLPKEEVEKHVEPGNPITRDRELIKMGECINGKSLDNRVSVFILIETLRELKDEQVPFDLYAVFTVQEEVGLRGAGVSALKIQPDFGIGLDTTIAFDTPGAAPHERVTELGKGTAIKVLDGHTICDYRMVNYLKELAGKHDIAWQPEVLPAGGTDTAMVQRMSAGGSIAGAISIPLRNMHQVVEMNHSSDIRHSIDLLKACVQEFDGFDWSFK